MRRVLLTGALVALIFAGYGQTTELTARLNSGTYYFTGESVESVEQINYNLTTEDGYTNNPYGNRMALSYGISATYSRITKSNIRLGIDGGFELLRSKIDINQVSLWDGTEATVEEASGRSIMNNAFLNVFPSLGYRLALQSINLDFDVGLDAAYCLASTERGKATSSTRTYTTVVDRKTLDMDIRGRYQLTVSKDRMGGYLGFSNGIRNYRGGFAGGTNLAFSQMVRFGLIYQLK